MPWFRMRFFWTGYSRTTFFVAASTMKHWTKPCAARFLSLITWLISRVRSTDKTDAVRSGIDVSAAFNNQKSVCAHREGHERRTALVITTAINHDIGVGACSKGDRSGTGLGTGIHQDNGAGMAAAGKHHGVGA